MEYPRGTEIVVGSKYAGKMSYLPAAGEFATIDADFYHYRDNPYQLTQPNVAMVFIKCHEDIYGNRRRFEIHVDDVVVDEKNKNFTSLLERIED